jgi:uncharacterized protein (TIGR02271 family)
MNQQTSRELLNDLAGRQVVDQRGDKVGTITDVYFDQDTNAVEWYAVSTGLFGTKTSFVPVAGSSWDDEGNVIVAHDKAAIKDAPRVEPDGDLSEDEERELYAFYGYSYAPPSSRPAEQATTAAPRAAGDDAATAVRSEEELTVDKHRQERGRVKLRKWVETDQVQLTVPIEREVVRVTRQPATGETRTAGDLEDDDQEIVLSEEVVDVQKRVVAKERVGLQVEKETEQVPVDETVRKERVEVDGDVDTGETQR